jgi:LPXTG-motif cell wall-anchored protein
MTVRTFAEEPAGTRFRSRAIRAGGALAVAFAAIGAVLLWGATALATPLGAAVVTTVTPSPSQTAGNATDCNTGQNPAGLTGSILLSDTNPTVAGVGEGTVDQANQFLTVHLDAGVTASGVVVKGGHNFNIYFGPFVGDITLAGMHAPLVPGGVPTISHWFVCGVSTTTTTTTTPSTTTPTTTTTTTSTTTTSTTSTSTSSTTSTEPGTTPGTPGTTTTPGGGNLPLTGTAIGGIVLAGVALIGGGATLLLLRRRRDATDAS